MLKPKQLFRAIGVHKAGTGLSLRFASRSGMRTKRTCSVAAIADAAFIRARSAEFVALQRKSTNRSFISPDQPRIQPVPSAHGWRTRKERTNRRLHVPQLLAQHKFAHAAYRSLRFSKFHRISRSPMSIWPHPRPCFPSRSVRLARRKTVLPFALAVLLSP
jgi:hypothetical protein